MTDIWTKEKRSEVMGKIRSRDTKPEIAVRKLLHGMGYRFTVNGPKNKSLPGRPDIVLPKYKTAVFVHGCFWHQHPGCKLAAKPASNNEFWECKFRDTTERDRRNIKDLESRGWKVRVIWECKVREIVKNPEFLRELIKNKESFKTLG